jgi:hypothetical protein
MLPNGEDCKHRFVHNDLVALLNSDFVALLNSDYVALLNSVSILSDSVAALKHLSDCVALLNSVSLPSDLVALPSDGVAKFSHSFAS